MIDEYRGGSYYYTYAKGIKTGTTDEAGHCLVTSASADGYSYIGVFLDSPIDSENDEYGTMIDAKALFRWALTSLELSPVATKETPICEEKVNLAWGKDSVQLVPEENINAIVPKEFEDSDIKIVKDVPESVDAPIQEGDVIGTATIYYNGDGAKGKQKIATVNLVSSESVERSGILYVLEVAKSIIFSKWFVLVIAVIIVLLIIYIIISSIIRKRNKKRRGVRRYRNF
jgi:D-alanyl-D-alanine carboxypeptidase (penicillin-binding protein 5/6)